MILALLLACDLSAEAPKAASDADGDGVSESAGDCDDHNPLRTPGADEVCDGIDNDCDQRVDDDPVDGEPTYPDADGDGYGDAAGVVSACVIDAGRTTNSTDCNDADPGIVPGSEETCDGIDQDCDGMVDEDPVGSPVWYLDADGDGFGDADAASSVCSQPEGYSANADDCDDADAASFPGAVDVCADGADQDCNALPDDGCGPTGDISLADADAILGGTDDGDGLGKQIGAADLDGDGVGDIALAAPGNDDAVNNGGAVYIVSGPVVSGNVPDLASVTIVDAIEGAAFGGKLVVTGDTQGDGLADMLVLATGYGNASVIYSQGLSGIETTSAVDVTLFSRGYGEQVAIGSPGDWDGDGLADVWVAIADSVSSGNGNFMFGGPADEPATIYINDGLRIKSFPSVINGIAPAGDANDDGEDDMLVSSVDGAWLLPANGFPGGEMSYSQVLGYTTFTGTDGDLAGYAVTAAGDVNGDSHPDFLVTAPYANSTDFRDAGRVYVVPGPVEGVVLLDAELSGAIRLDGGSYQEYLGEVVASADVGADDIPDVFAGAPSADDGTGIATLFRGPFPGDITENDATARLHGITTGDHAGSALASGDVDGDTQPDLLVGASGAGGTGAVYVVGGGR